MSDKSEKQIVYLQPSQYTIDSSPPDDIKSFVEINTERAPLTNGRTHEDIFAEIGNIRIQYDENLPPVLNGEFNLLPIADYLYHEVKQELALKIVADKLSVQLNTLNEKEREEFYSRLDVQKEFTALSQNPFAVQELHEAAWNNTKREMSFITTETFTKAIGYAIKNLIQQAGEINEDNLRVMAGLPARSAREQQRNVVNNAAKVARKLANKPPGRRKGSKPKAPVFNFTKLKRKVVSISRASDGREPTQKEMAPIMGYSGEDALRAALRNNLHTLKRHGHSTHHWKQLVKEILNSA